MWQRFTERARRVVFYAQEEAGRLGEVYVSTEHLLLGLVRDEEFVAVRILGRMGLAPGRIREELERQIARGDGRVEQDMQLTPRAKRVIDLAYDEARQLGNNYIGTEHLLLGLIREGEGLAGRILSKLGVDLERTRAGVQQLQDQAPMEGVDSSEAHPAEREAIGDLGVVRADEGQSRCLAFHLAAGVDAEEIQAVFAARDAHGYRDLVRRGAILWVDDGTPAKLLRREGHFPRSVAVRLLDGPHAGKAVWVPLTHWERMGPDESAFPPEDA